MTVYSIDILDLIQIHLLDCSKKIIFQEDSNNLEEKVFSFEAFVLVQG